MERTNVVHKKHLNYYFKNARKQKFLFLAEYIYFNIIQVDNILRLSTPFSKICFVKLIKL